jgi:hypothetical protein
MNDAIDTLGVYDAPLGLAASAPRQDDGGWVALDPLREEDLVEWLDSVSSDTTPSLNPWQPAPVLLPAAPIAEDYVAQVELIPNPSPAAATPSSDAASKGEKHLRPKQLAYALRYWMERCHTPYPTLEEQKHVAEALNIPVVQVTNFCNNFRKPLRPKELTRALRSWMERRHTPYATLEEKSLIAKAMYISVAQVTNFCNNYRKRFSKVGDKLTSYSKLASSQ